MGKKLASPSLQSSCPPPNVVGKDGMCYTEDPDPSPSPSASPKPALSDNCKLADKDEVGNIICTYKPTGNAEKDNARRKSWTDNKAMGCCK